MSNPSDAWETEPQPELATVQVAPGLVLAAIDCADGWAFASLLDGHPLAWSNPHGTGSAEASWGEVGGQ